MFDVHQPITDRYGELDEGRIGDYIDGLIDEFARSPEAKPLLDEGDNLSDAGFMMDYAVNHLGKTPATMSLRDFNEVVFGLLPEKLSTPPENGPRIVAVLRAFWSFLRRQYALPNAAPILKSLDDNAGRRLQAELANPANWGMAKSFVMRGYEAGYDMTTQEGVDAFMAEYNRGLLGGPLPGPLDVPPLPFDDKLLPLPPTPHKARDAKRKERKRQRQARKRNRRK